MSAVPELNRAELKARKEEAIRQQVHVCMYVCMCICLCVCLCVCMYVCMYICVCVCVYLCSYVCMCAKKKTSDSRYGYVYKCVYLIPFTPFLHHFFVNTFFYTMCICPTHYSLPTTHYPLPTTHYSLPTTHYPLPTTHYSLPTTHYPLLTNHYPLLTLLQVQRALGEKLEGDRNYILTHSLYMTPTY
jgi:hypothetical protein